MLVLATSFHSVLDQEALGKNKYDDNLTRRQSG